MIRKIVLLGSGGHATSLLGTLTRLNIQLAGYVSNQKSEKKSFSKINWLGNDETFLNSFGPNAVKLICGIALLPESDLRDGILKKYENENFEFMTLIDPTSNISTYSEIGVGSQILANCYIGPESTIGVHCVINTSATIEHDVTVKEKTHIAPRVLISGYSEIGKSTFIGAGSIISNSVNIGDNSVIGAGSTVISEVKDGWVVAGNPAKIIRKIFS